VCLCLFSSYFDCITADDLSFLTDTDTVLGPAESELLAKKLVNFTHLAASASRDVFLVSPTFLATQFVFILTKRLTVRAGFTLFDDMRLTLNVNLHHFISANQNTGPGDLGGRPAVAYWSAMYLI
jgi:hypothetical protein